ncbi:MAG: transcriptional regulator [Rikenellaceae bacterium]|nr:transcriptional regulator [Rikenellaceae bacterium]
MKRLLFTAIFTLVALVVSASTRLDDLLAELDAQLQQRDSYRANREQRIASLMSMKSAEGLSVEHNYTLNQQLIDEYVTFQADSAITYFQQNLALAHEMRNKSLIAVTSIDLAHFYASTGFYFEASQLLDMVDTLSLNKEQLVDYYITQHKLNDELSLYSNDEVQSHRSMQLTTYYSKRIIATAEKGSYPSLRAHLWLFMRQNDDANAALTAERMMEVVPELSREWATAAFMRGLVAQQMGDDALYMEWMIRSSIIDMRLGIRDYAALKSIADYCTHYDIERSMRYMRVMMEDVQAFNSRLRPWQDAMIWPEIEKGYHDYTERVAATQMRYIYLLVAMVVVVIVLLLYLMMQNRKLKDIRRKMCLTNDQLNTSVEDLQQVAQRLTELNAQIAEANQVKEEYIGVFMQVCSEYIDKMVAERRHIVKSLRNGKADDVRKELESSRLEAEELKHLYNLFDSTFLRLYPTFVEELNSLLAEESRITLKQGEFLNTQLRIFALIRLGINDTPRIATLLHCSLSTIYNYRSRIRYNAQISREDFEKRILTIGTFNR